LQRAESIEWLDRLEEEHDNLRAVLNWSLENDPETAARLAAVLRFFWIFHTHLSEGRGWMKMAFGKSDRSSISVRAKLLNGLGVAARNQGDYETAESMHHKSLVNGRQAGASQEITLSLRGLGALAVRRQDFTKAKYYLEKTLAISRQLNNQTEIAHTLSWLGNLRRAECDNTSARPFFTEALAIFREIDNKEAISSNLKELGEVDFEEGNYKTAYSYFNEGLDIVQKLRDKTGISYFLDGFAALAHRSRDLAKAIRLASAAEQLRESIGYETDSVDCRFREAYLAELRGAFSETDFDELYEQGRQLKLEEAIELALESN
jgi:tetratricopeptide (TPR) repeat protein